MSSVPCIIIIIHVMYDRYVRFSSTFMYAWFVYIRELWESVATVDDVRQTLPTELHRDDHDDAGKDDCDVNGDDNNVDSDYDDGGDHDDADN
jgi:hypothetical protein